MTFELGANNQPLRNVDARRRLIRDCKLDATMKEKDAAADWLTESLHRAKLPITSALARADPHESPNEGPEKVAPNARLSCSKLPVVDENTGKDLLES